MDEDQFLPNDSVVDYFGKLLMESVRDIAISHADDLVDGQMKARQWVGDLFASYDPQQRIALKRLIPEIVDVTFRLLLNILDGDENIEISIKTENGEVIRLREASEDLNMELYRWIGLFSHQRSNTLVNKLM